METVGFVSIPPVGDFGYARHLRGLRAAGAWAQSVLLSVLETCRRQSRSVLDYLSHMLRSVGNLLLPRPVLLPTR